MRSWTSGLICSKVESEKSAGAVDDLGQQLGAHQVHAFDGIQQGIRHVEFRRADAPARVGQLGQGQQAVAGGLIAQRARRAVRAPGDACFIQAGT